MVRQSDIAEDLAQDVFVRLWEKRESLNITSSIGAYLRRMAINEGISHLRKNKKVSFEEFDKSQHADVVMSAEDAYLGQELKHKIQSAIDTLPPRCRIIFQLSRHEELTYKEIAQKLDISVKTVENQMGKALKILRELLKNDLPKGMSLWWILQFFYYL